MLNLTSGSDEFRRLNADVLGEVRQTVGRIKTRPQNVRADIEFESDLEAQGWHNWIPTTGAVQAFYEPVTFHLSFDRATKLRDYTPDFWLIFPSGELWIVEVKGSFKAQGSGRSSKQNLLHAAVEFAWLARWFALLPKRQQQIEKRSVVVEWNLIEVTGQGQQPPRRKGNT